eukprot:768731-Pyramimonas_sp.AAC.1
MAILGQRHCARNVRSLGIDRVAGLKNVTNAVATNWHGLEAASESIANHGHAASGRPRSHVAAVAFGDLRERPGVGALKSNAWAAKVFARDISTAFEEVLERIVEFGPPFFYVSASSTCASR